MNSEKIMGFVKPFDHYRHKFSFKLNLIMTLLPNFTNHGDLNCAILKVFLRYKKNKRQELISFLFKMFKVRFKTTCCSLELLYTAFVLKDITEKASFAQNFCIS